MGRVESAIRSRSYVSPLGTAVPQQLLVPVVIGFLVVVGVLVAIVTASTSAWQLLGVGRGLVPPDYYHVSGFIVVLATTLGLAAGWAGGSGILYYVMTLFGFQRGFSSWRFAMSIVYLGVGAFPLPAYHVLFGPPLLGISREGLAEWLSSSYPDAYWLLISAHRWVDWSLIWLGGIFLGVLWLMGESQRGSRLVHTVLGLALLGTSLAVALSLAIHSTLVHLKIS